MIIIWSERAIDRLIAIHEYVSEKSPTSAVKIIQNIFNSVERIRSFPKLGRVVPEYERKEICEIIEAPYRVLYRK